MALEQQAHTHTRHHARHHQYDRDVRRRNFCEVRGRGVGCHRKRFWVPACPHCDRFNSRRFVRRQNCKETGCRPIHRLFVFRVWRCWNHLLLLAQCLGSRNCCITDGSCWNHVERRHRFTQTASHSHRTFWPRKQRVPIYWHRFNQYWCAYWRSNCLLNQFANALLGCRNHWTWCASSWWSNAVPRSA